MKIKMLTAIAGTNWSASHGHIVDMFDEAEAQRHIRSGNAEKAHPDSTVHITVGAARDPITPRNLNKAR